MISNSDTPNSVEGIAIIGMAGRFPAAKNIQEFWSNLKSGVESISFFSDEELAASGIDLKSIKNKSNYVRAAGILSDPDLFDAAFFGVSPREAELMDPQHRLLLEYTWEALENAGYDPESYQGSIGVYAGMDKSSYLLSNLYPNGNTLSAYAPNQTELANERDYLTTRISYKLNLKGPSVSVQTACSTSLVATVLAYQSLLNYQCDMALAGGVCVRVPQKQGYWFEETGVASPDGHCRPFDERAQGTVFGSGVGVVVLKRLVDAIIDGDSIYAVIKGAAMNNDGAAKLSYMAPSVDGQAEVVAMAQAIARVDPETVSYVECHGTGTPLGDPIEIAALTQAFRAGTDSRGFCAIGSVKSNIGHLAAAAGVASLIKTALALQHKLLPPSLHYEKPNLKCNFEETPFYVNAKLTEWKAGDTPRRAGVSSFGAGGTNVHAVLEEAPDTELSSGSRSWQLLQLSAKTGAALQAATSNLIEHLRANPDCNLADLAYTLQTGRRSFDYRRILVCRGLDDAVTSLEKLDARRVITQSHEARKRSIVFMFPGGGSQYVNMGLELYREEAVFRQELERCLELLKPHLDADLKKLLYPSEEPEGEVVRELEKPSRALPALFSIEYALAKLWMSWGLVPEAIIGHSMGEYTAACLAGVVPLEDALALVALRGRLFEQLPDGAMLSVPLAEEEIRPLLPEGLSFAAINRPSLCVVSGPTQAIDVLQKALAAKEIDSTRIHIAVAAHSGMVEPILNEFGKFLEKVELRVPRIPYVSNVTGTWIKAEQAMDPGYWVKHLRQTVRFSEGLAVLLEETNRVFLEVGPGQTLSGFAKQHPAKHAQHAVLSCLRHPKEQTSDVAFLLNSLGRLWLAGAKIDWSKFYAQERRRRVPLPTYPFERKRFWIDPPRPETQQALLTTGPEESLNGRIAEIGLPDLAPENGKEGVTPMPEPTIITLPASSRKERILAELIDITHDLSGIEVADLDVNASFLELGFDSLFLTQANGEFRKKFNVRITFRQLLNEAPTLDALAQFIDSKLPSEAFPEETPQPCSVPELTLAKPAQQQTSIVPPPLPKQGVAHDVTQLGGMAAQAPASASALERVINQQLQVMSQQLALLRNGDTGAAILPVPGVTPSGRSIRAGPAVKEDVPWLNRPVETDVAAVPNGPESGESKLQRFGPWKPIDKSAPQGLDSRQQKHLNNLIRRYTTRTQKSKQLAQTQRSHLADLRTLTGFRRAWKEMVYQIAASRSSGSKVWDIDGNEYVDLTMSYGINLFGHSPVFIKEAVEEQLAKGLALGLLSPLAHEVADLISELTGMERVTFVNTGSEAVSAAIRAARTITGRDRIAVFEGDYHGISDEVLVRSVTVKGKRLSVPVAPGIPRFLVENVLVLDYADPHCLDVLRTHSGELAAVVIEPVQSRHPDLQPREILHAIRKISAEREIALIFDEMITGFRLHPRGAQAWYGVDADIAVYGKALSGGLPLAAVAGDAKFMDAFDGGMWQYGDDSFPETDITFFGGTFIRHPLSLAASLAALKYLKKSGPELQEQLNERANRFARDLNEYFAQRLVPIHLQNCGSMLYLGFLEESEFSSLLFYYLREKGVHVWEGRPFFISTAHTDEDLEFVIQAFRESIAEMQDAGFLPPSDLSAEKSAPQTKTNSSDQVFTITLPAEVGSNRHSRMGEFPNIDPEAQEFPLTESQMEIWLATRLGEDASRAFNESFTVRLKGKLDLKAMDQAAQQLVDRHDALRATVGADGDYQRIASSLPVDLPLTDLSNLEQGRSRAQLASLLNDELQQSFDLVKGPLLRLRMFKLDEEDHLLQLVAHHIVCDGWSFGVLLDDLAVLYSAAYQGTDADLTEPLQFREYAAWQQEQRHSTDGAAVEAYWLGQFSAGVPVLDLPADRPRPPIKTYNCGQEQIAIDKVRLAELKQLSVQRGATSFATLLAIYLVLLHRLSGQEDIIVGLGAAGQFSAGSTNLVGHCVNFLPLRSQISGDQRFSEYLATVQNLLLDAYDHQNYTFGSLIKKLTPPRDSGRLPLISTIIAHETATAGLNFADLNAEVAGSPKSFCNFDLELYLMESDVNLTIDCRYNTDLFDAGTIRRWLRYYQTLLQGIAANPEERVANLPILTDAEKQQLLFEWNGTKTAYPKDRCIHELFEERVDRSPEAVAVVFNSKELTYRELNRQANQLAHYLQKLGVGPEALVGVSVDRSIEMVVALLGILKAGGAYVPLDPAYPRERLDFILKDAKVEVVLTTTAFLGGLPELQVRVVCLDTESDRISRESEANLVHEETPDNLAYVIYTSGSTGRPKGVPITHQNVVRLFLATDEWFRFSERDVWTLFHSYAFDFSVWELWGALIYGGRLVIVPYLVSRSPKAFYELLVRERVTVLNQTPSAFRQLIEAEDAVGQKELALRYIIFGGEALEMQSLRPWYERHGARRPQLVNMYGITETTVHVTYRSLSEKDLTSGSLIGKPIPDLQVYLLNDEQLVPVGVPGEMFVGGEGLARGYLNRPDLTAERFVPNPFAQTAGERLYRTGDRARYLPDGSIEFIGRADNQVKIRGFRIELGEIEAVIKQHESVRDAVVVVRQDDEGEKRLVAYMVLRSPSAASSDTIREFLRVKLPGYMIPGSFVMLQNLPLTANGKINYQALPTASELDEKAEAGYVAGRDEIERKLIKIWEELLGVRPIGVKDNFFDLGGHSLLATRLIARIEKSLGNVSLSNLFQSPTIESLARELRQKKKAKEDSALVLWRNGGSWPPLFLHGGSFELSRYLGEDQPCYGIRPHGQDGRKAPATVEEMAADYLKQIRGVQPQGPYLIGGFSFGGLVAYEMAQQLRQSGQDVGLLVLIDPTPPRFSAFQPPNGSRRNSTLNRHLTALRQADSTHLVSAVRNRTQRMASALKRRVCGAYLKLGQPIPSDLRMFYFFEVSGDAARKYSPRPYHGRTVLLSSQPNTVGLWRNLVGGTLEVHQMQGDHLDAIKGPNVEIWGRQLAVCLTEADSPAVGAL